MSREEHTPAEQMAPDVFSRACASRGALHDLTGRWGALTIAALQVEGEAMRFAAIRRRVDGISDRMLSQTLGQLERDGMVERTVHSAIPPHVEYSLTPLGRRIAAPLVELTSIIESSLPQILAAQDSFDSAQSAQ